MLPVYELIIDNENLEVNYMALVDKPAIEKDFLMFASEAFESYADYPDGVQNNAKNVLEFADKNGWGACGTPVGKQRANQLANGEAISVDTIQRMYSYLSRHEVDLESSTSYSDGCGKLMYDAWGGKAALGWSRNKLRELGILNENSEQFVEDEACPIATQDIAVNITNRQKAIDIANYGPLNPNDPNEDYWQKKADQFNGKVEDAKKARCGNCSLFYRTEKILDCIAGDLGNEVDPYEAIDAGELGYCEAFDFKCAASRTCDAWVVGGPILMAKIGERGGINASPKAPKSGTENKNPQGVGSNKGDASGKGAKVSKEQEITLQNKADDFNEKESNTKYGRATLGQLKTVFVRGLGAFNGSHSPVVSSPSQWAFARCNAYLYLLKNGRPQNPKYVNDFDLLPKDHPKYSKEVKNAAFAIVDAERQIISGPAMLANVPIFRRDEDGTEYMIVFKPETIYKIAQKFFERNYQGNFNIMHNPDMKVEGVNVFESFIVDSKRGIKPMVGFEDAKDGSWFISAKVDNLQVWNAIKDGKIKGFSVEGMFGYKKQLTNEEFILNEIKEILSGIEL